MPPPSNPIAAAERPVQLPVWIRPLRFSAGVPALLAAGACVVLLEIAFLLDLVSPSANLSSLAFLPVLAGAWILSPRLALTVAVLAIVNRWAAGLAGQVTPLESFVDSLTIAAVALLGRVAAVYLAATNDAAARVALLARIGRISTSADSLRVILDHILAEMAGEGLRGGLIGLINERNEIYPAAAEGDIDDEVWNSRLPMGSGIMGTAAAEARSFLVSDIDAPDLAVNPINRALGSNSRIRSLVVVPLVAAGKVIGVLEIDSTRPGRFGSKDLALLEQIAFAVSGAVQREGALQLADELVKRRVEELTLLLDAARSLGSSLEPEVVLSLVVGTLSRAVRVEGGRAALVRIQEGHLTAISEHDGEHVRTRPIDLPLAFAPTEMLDAIASGHAHGAAVAGVDPGLHAVFGEGVKAFAWAPVTVGGQLYGVVAATSGGAPFEWPALRLLEGVADLAGLALGNAERLRLEQSRSIELAAHANRMAELEKVKSDFLKVASHELGGPLAVIKGYVSMLADGTLQLAAPSTDKVLEVVTMKLREISDLVEQMLETARLEDSRLDLRLRRLDLRQSLEEAAERVRPLAPARNRVSLRVGTRPAPVLGDRGRILTILTNLLDNALKYSPEGGDVEAAITLEGEQALVSVTDHGLGIAPSDQPRLFTRFGRIVTPANSHILGTGLGLYLAREMARMHGGDITLVSAEGVGSTFTLSLPLAADQARAGAELAAGTD